MARLFYMPFDMDQEDKIIGGYLSLRQFFWLSAPLIFILISFVSNKNYLKIVNGAVKGVYMGQIFLRLIIALILLTISIYMAFVTRDGINSDKYTLKKILFKLRKHTIKYSR